jgi:flagellin
VGAAQLGRVPINDIINQAIVGGRTPTLGGTITLGGFVSSLTTGSSNSLANNPSNAANIVEAAINQVNSLRAFLGGVTKGMLEPNFDALNVHIQELTKANSTVRDLDFADETARFLRNQILFQSNISVLASSNQVPQAILGLLR